MKYTISFLLLFIHISFFITTFFLQKQTATLQHFSSATILLHADDLIHNDLDIPLPLVRFFHNKITFFSLDIVNRALQYTNISYMLDLLTPFVCIGVSTYLWFFLTKLHRRNTDYFFIGIFFINPFIQLFLSHSLFFQLCLFFPYYLCSYFGYQELLSTIIKAPRKGLFLILFILLFSLWWILCLHFIQASYLHTFDYL